MTGKVVDGTRTMNNPGAAMLVIGDEILSGRTKDRNVSHLAAELGTIGVDLREVRIVPDEQDRIVESVNSLRRSHDYVFTCGGIGPTHDDITSQSIAVALGREFAVNEKARKIIADRARSQGLAMNEARLRMARMPVGSKLIRNSVSGAPGFIVENVHVLAGVPVIFRAMLSTLLPELGGGRPFHSMTVEVRRPEGELAGRLGEIASQSPELSIGSYPFSSDGIFGARVVVRGMDLASVERTMERIKQASAGDVFVE